MVFDDIGIDIEVKITMALSYCSGKYIIMNFFSFLRMPHKHSMLCRKRRRAQQKFITSPFLFERDETMCNTSAKMHSTSENQTDVKTSKQTNKQKR